MNTTVEQRSQEKEFTIEAYIEKEKAMMEHYRHRASRIGDPELQSLFNRLADSRASCCIQLESYVMDKNSRDILEQINEMFE